MADRRPDNQEMSRNKRAKIDVGDPAANPYLAHMYPTGDEQGYSNSNGRSNGSDAFAGLTRHETTAAQAHTAEDGPNNPYNGQPFSKRYFNILNSRRDLPVHKQRYV